MVIFYRAIFDFLHIGCLIWAATLILQYKMTERGYQRLIGGTILVFLVMTLKSTIQLVHPLYGRAIECLLVILLGGSVYHITRRSFTLCLATGFFLLLHSIPASVAIIKCTGDLIHSESGFRLIELYTGVALTLNYGLLVVLGQKPKYKALTLAIGKWVGKGKWVLLGLFLLMQVSIASASIKTVQVSLYDAYVQVLLGVFALFVVLSIILMMKQIKASKKKIVQYRHYEDTYLAYVEQTFSNLCISKEEAEEKHRFFQKLSPIQMKALKGLILMKYEEARERALDFDVTVIHQLKDLGLSEWDLCKMLELLLDKAIDTARESKGKSVFLYIECLDMETGHWRLNLRHTYNPNSNENFATWLSIEKHKQWRFLSYYLLINKYEHITEGTSKRLGHVLKEIYFDVNA